MMVHVNAANELEEELSSKPDSFFIDLKDSSKNNTKTTTKIYIQYYPLHLQQLEKQAKEHSV